MGSAPGRVTVQADAARRGHRPTPTLAHAAVTGFDTEEQQSRFEQIRQDEDAVGLLAGDDRRARVGGREAEVDLAETVPTGQQRADAQHRSLVLAGPHLAQHRGPVAAGPAGRGDEDVGVAVAADRAALRVGYHVVDEVARVDDRRLAATPER